MLNNSLIINIIKLYKLVKLILFIYSGDFSDMVNSLNENQSNLSAGESVAEGAAEKESKEVLSSQEKNRVNRRLLKEKCAEHMLGVTAALGFKALFLQIEGPFLNGIINKAFYIESDMLFDGASPGEINIYYITLILLLKVAPFTFIWLCQQATLGALFWSSLEKFIELNNKWNAGVGNEYYNGRHYDDYIISSKKHYSNNNIDSNDGIDI